MNAAVRVGAGAVVIAVLATTAALDHPAAARARPPRGSAQPVTSASFVCPISDGSDGSPRVTTVASVGGLLGSSGSARVHVTTRPLAGARGHATRLPDRRLVRSATVRPDHAVLVTATGPGAAGVVADQRRLIPDGRRRSLFSSPCLAPQVDVWLAGANGRIGFHDDLVIANPGTTMANVTVSAWAVTGALQPPKLRSLTIGPLTTVTLPVGDYAPDAALVAWHVHANSGRVAAALHDVRIAGIRAAGSDWIPPTQAPARRLVVPGISPGPGARRLILTNPGPVDATVTLRLVTDSGNFSPAGHPTLVVRARHTVPVDLAPSLNGAAGAVVATSDNPVVGVVLTQVTTDIRRGRPDVQWQVAAPQLQGPAVLADNTPPFQRAVRIYLTAPEAGGRVRLTGRDGHSVVVTVPHGRTTFLDPRDKLGSDATGPILFERLSGGDIYLSRTLFAAGAHGPLTTAEQPTPLPTPVTLPAVADDVRAGLSPAAMTGP